MPNYKYIVDILAKNGQFVQAMNQNIQKTSQLDKTVSKLGGVIAGAFSVAAVYDFGKASVQAYNDSAQASSALLVALKGRTDIQQRLLQQASQLQDITLFDDDETARAMSLVAAFVKQEDQIKTLIPLIQDFATAKQMDLASAADLVTKTFAGEMNALGRYGIKVEGAAGSTERLMQIQKGLNSAFGGQAEAAAKVGTAALQQLGNEYGNLQEVIGQLVISQQNQAGSFTKILTNATKGITSYLGKVATWSEAGFSFTESLVAAFGATDEETQKLSESMVVATNATDKASESASAYAEVSKYQKGTVGALGEEITKLNEQLANTNANDIRSIQLIGDKIAALERLQGALKNISSDPASFRTDKFDTISPVAGVAQVSLGDKDATEMAKMGSVLDSYSAQLDANQEKVDKWRASLIENQQAVTGAFQAGFQQIGQSAVDGLGLADTGIQGFLGSLLSAATEAIAIYTAQSIAAAIAGGTESGASTGPGAIVAIPSFISILLGTVTAAFATMPKLASGGLAYGPTMALMGEYPGASSNPEVIAPLSKLKGMLGSGNSQTIVLQPSLETSGDNIRVLLNRVENNVRKRT